MVLGGGGGLSVHSVQHLTKKSSAVIIRKHSLQSGRQPCSVFMRRGKL